MVKLKRVLLQNYKSCVETVLDLNDGLTALIGINGSGKTNILQAIELLYTARPIWNGLDAENAYNHTIPVLTFVFRCGDVTVELRASSEKDADNHSTLLKVKHDWKIDTLIRDKWVYIPLELIPSIESNSLATVKSYLEPQQLNVPEQTIINFLNHLSRIRAYCDSIRYYSAYQFSSPESMPEVFNPGNGNWGFGEKFLFDLYNTREKDNDLFKRYFNLIGPDGVHMIDALDFKLVNFDEDKIFFIPVFTVNGIKLAVKELSDGTFRTMSLLFYLTCYDNALVLFEEPENSIHHGLLKSIIEVMQSEAENRQIVFSTHSDFVLDLLKPNDLVFVANGTGGTKARNLPEALTESEKKALYGYLENQGGLGQYWKECDFDRNS